MKSLLVNNVPKTCVPKAASSCRLFGQPSGFTLVELMVVVAIIGILAAVSTPAFLNWLPNYRLKNAAMDVYSTLQKARLYAIKSSAPASVVFTVGGGGLPGSYAIELDGVAGLSAGDETQTSLVGYGSGVDFGFRAGLPNWNGTAIVNALTFLGAPPACTFTPQGTANWPGTVYLINGQQHLVYAITVVSSGAVKIRQYNGLLPLNQNNWY